MSNTTHRAESPTGDVAPLKCSVTARKVQKKSTRSSCVLRSRLIPYRPHMVFPTSIWYMFRLSPASFCLAVILGLAICFPSAPTTPAAAREGETARRKNKSEEEEAGDDRERALIDIWTGLSRGHVEGLLPLRYQTFRPREIKILNIGQAIFVL